MELPISEAFQYDCLFKQIQFLLLLVDNCFPSQEPYKIGQIVRLPLLMAYFCRYYATIRS